MDSDALKATLASSGRRRSARLLGAHGRPRAHATAPPASHLSSHSYRTKYLTLCIGHKDATHVVIERIPSERTQTDLYAYTPEITLKQPKPLAAPPVKFLTLATDGSNLRIDASRLDIPLMISDEGDQNTFEITHGPYILGDGTKRMLIDCKKWQLSNRKRSRSVPSIEIDVAWSPGECDLLDHDDGPLVGTLRATWCSQAMAWGDWHLVRIEAIRWDVLCACLEPLPRPDDVCA